MGQKLTNGTSIDQHLAWHEQVGPKYCTTMFYDDFLDIDQCLQMDLNILMVINVHTSNPEM